MRILILGGTVFLGRHLVQAALARGHALTLFNRGKSNPALFPGLERLHGDRKEDLSALEGRTWDAVIDTCGYVPRVVRASAEALAEAASHYTFISSISVYPFGSPTPLTEATPVGRLEDQTVEEVTGETYGPLKALCEEAVETAFPGRALDVRPGLIVGPHDPTDRFTYWPARIARGGEVLAPGNPEAPVQFIDVRDLSEWTVRLIEAGTAGPFNATGPESTLTMGRFLEESRSALGSDARFTWVPDGPLLEAGAGPWMELPLWIPQADEAAVLHRTDLSKALASGLRFRTVAETVRDTLAWDQTRPPDAPRKAGITPERERELLTKYHELKAASNEPERRGD
jgi:2'-hydroxyisoflavone reductase